MRVCVRASAHPPFSSCDGVSFGHCILFCSVVLFVVLILFVFVLLFDVFFDCQLLLIEFDFICSVFEMNSFGRS